MSDALEYKVERYEGKLTQAELRQHIERENESGWRAPGLIHSPITDYLYVVYEKPAAAPPAAPPADASRGGG